MADGSPKNPRGFRFGSDDAALVRAIAEAVTPEGRSVRAADETTVRDVERVLDGIGADAGVGYVAMLRALDLAAVPVAGARLRELDVRTRLRAIDTIAGSVATHAMVRIATAPIKIAQVIHADFPAALGGRTGLDVLPVQAEKHAWDERVMDAGTLPDGETIEVDTVIVGTGAGGAPLAHALASRGHAVLMLEVGGFLDRRSFGGRPIERAMRFQHSNLSIGNTVIVVPTGKSVGGTTTVNSGTCFRTPADVMRRWRFEDGITGVDPATMAPFFERVEAMLQVGPNERKHLGTIADIVARGADALGWSHEALHRNAPDCDGQGVCCFGCPTDAKRSTNVSYVPAALQKGAMLVHHARVEEVLLASGRAVGVVARATHGNEGRVRVLAKSVVLSGGALHTPALLLKLGLANSSGLVGHGLTVHPAGSVHAFFDEEVRGWEGVPQGYGVDEFASEGIRFEGASLPIDIAAPTLPAIGARWTEFVDRYDHVATFGYMIADSSRGRVVLGPQGKPQILYVMNDYDRRRMLRGQALLSRLFLAAGAREVLPSVQGVDSLRSVKDVEALEAMSDSIGAHRLDLSAYHPLGTCRMGSDPRRSVVSGSNETHDVSGLFVVDGSTVNGPLGVNPQVTIMAMSERAAGFVERRIERGVEPRIVRVALPEVEFTETMSGTCTFAGAGTPSDAAFTVRCSAPDKQQFFRRLRDAEGGCLALDGTATIAGLATERPCTGTLRMFPKKRIGTLVYDLDFTGDDGARYHLHGQKSVSPTTVLSGMTTLRTEIARADTGVPVATGTLRFWLRDFLPWLATFRFRARRARITALASGR
ncbi:MAG: GMC family oxidoreductase [Sandaracinaceae bacterium]|jgi:choline dehydrogenase-like flavoprotein|nr:GMC family oxidoreductase [Sandaracinaceae bacterium]MBP7680299.1 GMC family oxidoreductase [Deltaproteobacteria bacterium]MBK7154933.1 GMC family oxidoreductase [Sandaracinaceae bacterium]MBK7772929.1 GMC family oxidoreductase [Sandaracinaceae bacterium]MBK8407139.1 GMC family oxidoreductase [Sandaracinaceae bacterium]